MRLTPIVLLLLPALGGCGWCSDVTDSAQVRAGGMIGRGFVLTRELRLITADYCRWSMLLSSDHSDSGSAPDVGGWTLPEGTRLTLVKVEQCGYPFVMNFTLARVENGAMAGKVIATNRAGMGFNGVLEGGPDFKPLTAQTTQPARPGGAGGSAVIVIDPQIR